jgi:DNA repair exonuclease SbcCD ATPase subunit
MNLPSAPATHEAAPQRTTVDDRAAALMARLEESPAEPAAETPEDASPVQPDGTGTSTADSAGEAQGTQAAAPDAELEKRREERRQRIEQVRAKEAAAAEERARREASRAKEGEAEKLRKRLEELEPLNDVFSSEEALLEMAEKRGMSAEKLVQWMRSRITDPAAIASQRAKSEADKIREELAAERRAREELEKRLAEKEETAREAREATERAQSFVSHVEAQAAGYPLTAKLLHRHGPAGLVAFANRFAIPMLSDGYTLEELHDHVEQILDEVQVVGADVTPAKTTTSPKTGKDSPPTTLSNAMASERTTVTEEIPLHRLSIDERVARLKAKLASE